VLDSVTLNAMTSALDGFTAAQRAIATNIANVNTPGYHAQEVNFSQALARSVAEGDGTVNGAAFIPTRSLAPTRLDGNNVSLAQETLDQISTNLTFQLASQAVSQQFAEVRSAAKTG
jgi:flagellar basal-body rod protein FlgB